MQNPICIALLVSRSALPLPVFPLHSFILPPFLFLLQMVHGCVRTMFAGLAFRRHSQASIRWTSILGRRATELQAHLCSLVQQTGGWVYYEADGTWSTFGL